MACKGAKRNQAKPEIIENEAVQPQVETEVKETVEEKAVERLFFGVDSQIPANDILQNNITLFEWAVRNKAYPNFWGRNLVGENALTKEEIDFIHKNGCKVAAIYKDASEKTTFEQGTVLAKKLDVIAFELGIRMGSAIFLEIGENENVTTDFMKGFAETMYTEGFTPGFKANTDAAFDFDREFSRGMQTDKEIFEKCIIWATAPTLEEYNHITTTHFIHPDNWKPFAPSGITRQDIAVWQYGMECHPINDDAGKKTTFNVDLIRDAKVLIEKMF